MHDTMRAAIEVSGSQHLDSGFDAVDAVDGDTTLRTALDALSPRYQRALGLRFLADLTNEEAAIAMGVSRTTMAVIVHRARAALRKQLVDAGGLPDVSDLDEKGAAHE